MPCLCRGDMRFGYCGVLYEGLKETAGKQYARRHSTLTQPTVFVYFFANGMLGSDPRKVGMNDTSSRTLLRSAWCIALVLLFCCVQGAGRKAYVQETTLDAQHVELIESFTPAAPSHTRYFIESGTAVLPDISSSRAKRLFHPILFLFFLALYPVCTRVLRACPLREVLLPRLSDIRGLLPLPLAPPSLFF